MPSFKNQNELNQDQQTRLIDQLDHRCGRGKWILDKDLEDLALKKYQTNGKGITLDDLVEEYKCLQTKAQRRLKNACKEKIDKDGKKRSALFRLDDKRTIPQQYFPSCIRATIIENKRNRLIDPTGANYHNKSSSSSYYPLHNAVENQIVQSFLLQLSLLPWQPLNMHNIHMLTIVDKSHYEEIKLKPCSYENKTKIQRERIGLREVVYQFHKKGSIEIDISCSKYPFPIETDNDVNNLFVFLGKVHDRLSRILSDPRERIIPSIETWILKYCDFNKDVDVESKNIGQLMDLNIQIKYAGKSFRLYVKNLQDKFVLREERTMKVDQTVSPFMNDSILNPFHLMEDKLNEVINIFEKKLNEVINKFGKE